MLTMMFQNAFLISLIVKLKFGFHYDNSIN